MCAYVCVRLHVCVFICVCRVYVACLLNLYLHMILYAHNALLRVIMPETVSVVLVWTLLACYCNPNSILLVCMYASMFKYVCVCVCVCACVCVSE